VQLAVDVIVVLPVERVDIVVAVEMLVAVTVA
jgi:hypothetical protein